MPSWQRLLDIPQLDLQVFFLDKKHQLFVPQSHRPKVLAEIAAMAAMEATSDNSSRVIRVYESAITKRAQPLVIQTYFYNVYETSTLGGGYVPEAWMASQLNGLNQDFRSANIQFKLVNYYFV